MVFVQPTMIRFENKQDIVDYVSRGVMPTKKNFEAVMAQVRYPTKGPRTQDPKRVYIEDGVIPAEDRELVAALMERVYENRRWNRNVALATIGGVAGIVLLGTLCSHASEKEGPHESITLKDDIGECHFLNDCNRSL